MSFATRVVSRVSSSIICGLEGSLYSNKAIIYPAFIVNRMAIFNLLDQTSGLNMFRGVLSMCQIEDAQPLIYVQGNLLTASMVVVTVSFSLGPSLGSYLCKRTVGSAFFHVPCGKPKMFSNTTQPGCRYLFGTL